MSRRWHEIWTTGLDTAGLLAVAGGVGAGVAPWIGWFGVAVGGVIVLVGSALADRWWP